MAQLKYVRDKQIDVRGPLAPEISGWLLLSISCPLVNLFCVAEQVSFPQRPHLIWRCAKAWKWLPFLEHRGLATPPRHSIRPKQGSRRRGRGRSRFLKPPPIPRTCSHHFQSSRGPRANETKLSRGAKPIELVARLPGTKPTTTTLHHHLQRQRRERSASRSFLVLFSSLIFLLLGLDGRNHPIFDLYDDEKKGRNKGPSARTVDRETLNESEFCPLLTAANTTTRAPVEGNGRTKPPYDATNNCIAEREIE